MDRVVTEVPSMSAVLGKFAITQDEQAAIAVARALVKRQFDELAKRWNVYADIEELPMDVKLAARDALDSILDALLGCESTLSFFADEENVFAAFARVMEEAQAFAEQSQDEAKTDNEAQTDAGERKQAGDAPSD